MFICFDYECKSCGEVNEIFHKNSTAPICPNCNSSDMQRHLAAPTISYAGPKTLRQSTPDGFKDVLKQTIKTVPEHYRGKEAASL